MSWSNLEQFVIPVTLTTFMVAMSLLVPGVGARAVPPPPADPTPMARPSRTRQGRPVDADARPAVRPPAPRESVPAAVAGPALVVEEPSTGRDRGGSAGETNGPPGRTPVLRPPVDGPMLRGFEAPASPFGPGHRGVDLGAEPGAPLTTPAPGRVRFAGRVGGVGWITVEIAPAVTVSIGPVARIKVRAGDDVGGLTVLGDAAAGHGAGVHLGLRIRGAYVDPQPYLVGFGPARLVPLEPPGSATVQRPNRAGGGSAPRRRGSAPPAARRRRRSSGSGRATPRASAARRRPDAATRTPSARTASRRRPGSVPSHDT